ncbi:GspE/PulE/PilB domain-containing protein [Persicimonas caeni]|uniref:GspE/PulE/PilB domain-containing protein n=1 Tax=Persicimonas caeni TaxID=2292766 RepID=UPI00143D37F7|nr:hypothetical protein [Persicimonas caeni]
MTESLLDNIEIDPERVQRARQRAQDLDSDVVSQLLVAGDLAEKELLEALSEQTGLPAADPTDYTQVDRDAFETLDADLIRQHCIIPFRKHRRSLAVFVVEPLDQELLENIADEHSVTLSQFVWPRLRFTEALHTLLGDAADGWLANFMSETNRRVSFGGGVSSTGEHTEIDLDSLGVGWSREDTLEFLRNCYDRDALLHALLGFSSKWLDNRMVLVLGHERAQPYLVAGWPELSDDFRDIQTLRRVNIDVPPDAVLFDANHVGHSMAEMPEDVGLGQLFVELTLFPPDNLLVQTVRIGSRPSMAVIGEPRSDSIPSAGPLEEVARAVGDQLEELVRLAKARQLPPTSERIPALPESSEQAEAQSEDDPSPGAMPSLAEAASSASEPHEEVPDSPSATSFGIPFADAAPSLEEEPEEDKPGATAFGIPFADQADGDKSKSSQRSAVEVSSPGVGEESSVSIIQPVDLDEDEADGDGDEAEVPEAFEEADEDVRSTMSGGFSVAEFEQNLNPASSSAASAEASEADGDFPPSEAEDADDSDEDDKANAPMFQILRPVSLKGGRKSSKKKSKSSRAEESEPFEQPEVDAEDEPGAVFEPVKEAEAEAQPAVSQSTEQDDLFVERDIDVERFPSIEIEAPIHDDSTGFSGSDTSIVEELEEAADKLDNAQPHEAFVAAEQIAGFGKAAMALLEERFPGRLLVDRYQFTIETLPPVSEHGPVLAALAQAGEHAVPVAASYLGHTSVELRFYATYLFTKLPIEDVLDDFIPRLFDRDQQTRSIAKIVLLSQRRQPWFTKRVLPELYDVVASAAEDLKVEVSAQLLGALRERGAVPLLIDCLERFEGRVREDINKALREITYKNFVPSASEWKNWWVDAQHQSRHDWLVAALNSTSEEMRYLVFDEVQEFDELELNYHPDQPAKLRGRAQQELRQWLEDS